MPGFERISTALHNILKNYQLESEYQEQLIIKYWDQMVDQRITSVARPVSLKNGVLELQALSASWKKELINNKDNLLKMINDSINQIKITEIKLK
ncbi:MAG: DUF721 domain-containing protein [Calditrichaceae bacterium]|nr:DUF721 domain-containing protein [Calditrichaceae bacterium]MBN2710443.1 DUF721 domain-containing protein [Calditrichaceae bacterium]RQV93621.1 MAG: DUF721 domain-containing protein [Calditrichota bacterium]